MTLNRCPTNTARGRVPGVTCNEGTVRVYLLKSFSTGGAARADAPTASREYTEHSVRRLLGVLKQTDVDTRALLQSAGIPVSVDAILNDGVRRLDTAQLRRMNSSALWALTGMASRQDGRQPARPDDLPMLFYCLSNSRTLREAIGRTSRFFRMLEERWGTLELQVQGATAQLCFETARMHRNAVAFVVDVAGLAVLYRLFCWLIAHPVPLSSITMEYDKGLRPLFDATALPFPLELEADRTALCFGAEYLDFPVVQTMDDYDRFAAQVFEFELPDDVMQASFAERVRATMYSALRKHRALPSLEALSEQLACTAATMRRHLSRAGTSYNRVKDSCRRELALDLLRRSTLSVEEISVQLGYCDSDAFRRAFRDWMEMSPQQYRKAGLVKSAACR